MEDRPKSPFTAFCHSTSLHGWQYLSRDPKGGCLRTSGRCLWFFIVAVSMGAAAFFLFISVDDFTSKYVVTSIDTTTASLDVCRSYLIFDFMRDGTYKEWGTKKRIKQSLNNSDILT